MRFQIDIGRAVDALGGLCQIRWQGVAILLKRRHVFERKHEGLIWMWPDGVEYTLWCPRLRVGGRWNWSISSDNVTHCLGRIPRRPLRKTICEVQLEMEWNLSGYLFTFKPIRCSGGQLVQPGGRRVALWDGQGGCARAVRRGIWVEGVWRNSLPESIMPLIVGMILAQLWDYR